MPDKVKYEQAARRTARYLASRQQPDGSFPGPDHYGRAFALWLWSHLGEEFRPQLERVRSNLQEHPPRDHGEFNVYALLHCRDRVGADFIRRAFCHLRFGHRHAANWMLLRAVCRAESASRLWAACGLMEARFALLRYARGGFIADRAGVRSLSYHAFCGALLADLWQYGGFHWAGAAAVRAARLAAAFVLPNGDSLYLGRGQQQIFGYGALLYLLEAAAQMTGRMEFLIHANHAFGHLSSFQREDGSFPLVLCKEEPREPWSSEAHPGWYSYNRYADYLPFLGCMLLKAADPDVRCFNEADRVIGRDSPPSRKDFQFHIRQRYSAVLSRPGGASTNDLAFPYACVDGVSLFPCYGAESRNSPEAMPLPYGVFPDGRTYAFRQQLRYRLADSALLGFSSLAHHSRRFEFRLNGFTCRDEITFQHACQFARFAPVNFLFKHLDALPDGSFKTALSGAGALLRLSLAGAICDDAAVTASGRLAALRCIQQPFRAQSGERVEVALDVQFT